MFDHHTRFLAIFFNFVCGNLEHRKLLALGQHARYRIWGRIDVYFDRLDPVAFGHLFLAGLEIASFLGLNLQAQGSIPA